MKARLYYDATAPRLPYSLQTPEGRELAAFTNRETATRLIRTLGGTIGKRQHDANGRHYESTTVDTRPYRLGWKKPSHPVPTKGAQQ